MPIPKISGYVRGPKGYSWINPYTGEIEYGDEPPRKSVTGTPEAEALAAEPPLPEGYAGITPPTHIGGRLWEAPMPSTGYGGMVEHTYAMGAGTIGEGRGFTVWEQPTITPEKRCDDTIELMYKGMLSQAELEYDEDKRKARNSDDPNWDNYTNIIHLRKVQQAEGFRERYRLMAKQIRETDKFDDEQKAVAFYKLLDKAEGDAPIKVPEREPTPDEIMQIMQQIDIRVANLQEPFKTQVKRQLYKQAGLLLPTEGEPELWRYISEQAKTKAKPTEPAERTWGLPTLTKPAYRVRPTTLPRPKTRQERDKLSKGTSYIDPEGNMRVR